MTVNSIPWIVRDGLGKEKRTEGREAKREKNKRKEKQVLENCARRNLRLLDVRRQSQKNITC